MSRGLALLAVLIAAFLVLVGVLGMFAGIAPAIPTTEESFLKFGSMPKIKDIVLVIVGAIFVAAGYFLTRFAGKLSVKQAAATPAP